MENDYQNANRSFSTKDFKKTIKIIVFLFIGLFSLILISAIGVRLYFERNKAEIVEKINNQINENILGEVKIGDIGFKFLTGFPNFTVVLNDVELNDSLFSIHKRKLLRAKDIEVRLNVMSLLKKEVNIHKIVINNATIDLFKDKNGVSNSNIFKPKKKKSKNENNTSTSINEVVLKNVNFISENQRGNKLFYFQIKSLKSKITYSAEGWKTNVHLKTFAKSLAFNTQYGSFVRDKEIDGKLIVDFSKRQDRINVITEKLEIGGDSFKIKAYFNVGKENSLFNIDIKTNILWHKASNLLAKNISSRLDEFALKLPLEASCAIKGDMNAKGDPEIVVFAVVEDDQLKTSYGLVENCSFKGKFTNNYKNGLGFNDANSAIIITNFKGDYNNIPASIPSGVISNFEKPVASGKFNSEFNVEKLKSLINEDFIKFSEGTAKVNLDFKFDIVNLKLNKPDFNGNIVINNTSFYYKPKNINFQKTDIELYFTEKALLIKKFKFQNKTSTVYIEGRADNFLNLYYDAPEKMTINWKIYSPYLDIKQIISTLSYQDKSVSKKNKNQSSDQLQEVFSKSKANLELLVDKLSYKKMVGSQFKVNIALTNSGLYVKKGSMQGSAGSSIYFDAQMVPKNELLFFKSNVNLKDGEISRFLASFNNFGVKSFTPNNIRGKLSLKASLSGTLNSEGDLIERSVVGKVKFEVKNGTLKDFEPIQKIGKIAFSNRNVSTITFSDLYANATIKGDIINVEELKVTSNVLNFDVNGLYSLSNTGTNLAVKIPLRNPKDDYLITNLMQREERRYKGIVLNFRIVDGEDGKTKIKLGKASEEESEKEPAEIKKSRNK